MLRSHRMRDIATGLAAVAALLAIVAAVPLALVRFIGWPFPASLPTLDAISAALRYGQIAPSTLTNALAVIVWVTWLLMTAGILVELVALARGTIARTLPTIGGLQRLSARLLAAAMLLTTLTTRPTAAPAAVAPASMVTPVAEPSVDRDEDRPAPEDTWVVKRHDSLWTIAERTLGDGHRWREIRDLNVGRTQPGGRALRADDTMIQPGWVLRLPAEATEDRSQTVEVQRGDHLWGLAEAHLGDGARWRQLYEHNAGAPQPDGRRLTRPDLIRPGWVLTLPARRASREVPNDRNGRATPHDSGDQPHGAPNDRNGRATPKDSADQPPVPPLPVTPLTLSDAHGHPSDRPTEAGTGSAVVAASTSQPEQQRDAAPIAGIALLAAGLVGVLARRRRNWLRRRQAGSALEPIDPEAAELERWLRAMADHDLTHRVDRVLCLLTEQFAAHEVHPAILALQLGEEVSLLLAEADTSPPPGITASDDGRTWTLDATFEVAAPLDDRRAPLIPALVGCGRRSTGENVALNLLHVGVLEVAGSPRDVEQALTSWTAELASSGAAAGVELIVVGPHHHLVEEFARVTIADDAEAAISRVDRLLGVSSGSRVNGVRGHASHVVVLSTEPVAGRAWTTLRERADHDPRLALVVRASASEPAGGDRRVRASASEPAGGDQTAAYRLLVDDDRVRLDPAGIELVVPEWLTPQTWDRFGDLLRQPVRQQQSDLVPSPLLTAPLDRRLAQLATLDADDDTEPARMIRVLGPLHVDGIPAPAPLVGDLLAYLAVHNEGVSVDTLSAHLGAEHGESDQGALVAAAAASQTLITVDGNGHFRLADGVGSDLGRFRLLTRQLDHQTPASQASQMQAALALVRGVPFRDSGGWAHAEGLVTATIALICDIAHRLTTLVMTFGDLDRATWAVDQGMVADPECELLYRDRMRIADAHGDHVALDTIMHDLRARAGTDDGWVTPETLQLYERLKRSSTITAAPTDPRPPARWRSPSDQRDAS